MSKKKKNLKQNRVNELYNACMHAAYGADKNKDNTNSEERERHRGAYGDIDSSEARERCMLGRKSFPIGRKWES